MFVGSLGVDARCGNSCHGMEAGDYEYTIRDPY